jgi:hypothetical protein
MSKLSIPIRMLLAFNRFTVCLQAITTFVQKSAHRVCTHREPLARQLFRQRARALACPAKRRHRITARTRIDELLQRFHELRLLRLATFATAARTALLVRRWRVWIIKLFDPVPNVSPGASN